MEFTETYKELAAINRAFGYRVFIRAIRMDHHEVELPDFDHMADYQTGRYEVELGWRMKRCTGGAHIVFAVESNEGESSRDNSRGREVLEALEALVRISLGATTVMTARRTFHTDLIGGKSVNDSPSLRVYSDAESPRFYSASIEAAIELARRSDEISPAIAGRLALGMRWANTAFVSADLLGFWTAIEITSGCRGRKAYSVLAEAYGEKKSNGQVLAKRLGLDVIYDLRGLLAHTGCPVHMDPDGASYLNSVLHDFARHAAGLSCRQLAKQALGQHCVSEWFHVQQLT